MSSAKVQVGRAAAILGGCGTGWYFTRPKVLEELHNFSETHKCHAVVERPKTAEEVRRLVESGKKLRAVGSGLSPNGLAFPESGDVSAVSLSEMDGIISYDNTKHTVIVQAGCTVRTIQDFLSEKKMTLQNFSSITDQEIAGWTQVAAHGTGAALPTVDEQIISLKIATPSGEHHLSRDKNPVLFSLAKVCCGTLGVVTELELQCAPSHRLKETILVETRAEAHRHHYARLRTHKHLKYMYIPTEDKVVVVTADPTEESLKEWDVPEGPDALKPFKNLLGKALDEGASFSQYRGEALSQHTTEYEYVKKVNKAEAEYWSLSTGSRVADSFDVLGFDCGGHQWVYEVCVPSGAPTAPTGSDVGFLNELLQVIESNKIPAPSPIEVRFTSSSTSLLSPAYSKDPDEYFTWVGIIMYLPPGSDRRAITSAFSSFRDLTGPIQERYKAVPHWAKIEPSDGEALKRMGGYYKEQLEVYKRYKAEIDPENRFPWSVLDRLREQA